MYKLYKYILLLIVFLILILFVPYRKSNNENFDNNDPDANWSNLDNEMQSQDPSKDSSQDLSQDPNSNWATLDKETVITDQTIETKKTCDCDCYALNNEINKKCSNIKTKLTKCKLDHYNYIDTCKIRRNDAELQVDIDVNNFNKRNIPLNLNKLDIINKNKECEERTKYFTELNENLSKYNIDMRTTLATMQAQKANLEEIKMNWPDDCKSVFNIPNSINTIKSFIKPKFCLDIYKAKSDPSTPVIGYECHREGNQLWKYDSQKQLIVQHSGHCLDVLNGGTLNGTPVVQSPCNNSLSQKWVYDNYNHIVPQHITDESNKCLSLDSSNKLIINDCSLTDKMQQFY